MTLEELTDFNHISRSIELHSPTDFSLLLLSTGAFWLFASCTAAMKTQISALEC